MKFYNTLTKKTEEFKAIHPESVGVYCCGPTVYSNVTIGNWRTYFLSDIVVRLLRTHGYAVTYVTNITDVGHLTGDNSGDSSIGEDRLEKASKEQNKTAWQIAEYYSQRYFKERDQLQLVTPNAITKATDFIAEQIAYTQQILSKGYAYTIVDDGIYFDVQKYETDFGTYSVFGDQSYTHTGRIEYNPNKRDVRDFALWKFSHMGERRHMEWNSPWGVGFPGWHIECSVMSNVYLGDQFDIHVGGEDLKHTHHPNEIAQSQVVTGKVPFVKYWLHGAFLMVDGGKMSKSLGNAYTISDLVEKGFNPLSLKYLFCLTQYRKPLNFTWESLQAAEATLYSIYFKALAFSRLSESTENNTDIQKTFLGYIDEDLNLPMAFAYFWDQLKNDQVSDTTKYQFIMFVDSFIGLGVTDFIARNSGRVPDHIQQLIDVRNEAKNNKDWNTADTLRTEIESKGYLLMDTRGKTDVYIR